MSPICLSLGGREGHHVMGIKLVRLLPSYGLGESLKKKGSKCCNSLGGKGKKRSVKGDKWKIV